MTPTDNNKILAICYLIYGGLIALCALGFFALPFLAWSKSSTGTDAAFSSTVTFAVVFGLFFLLLGAVPLVTAFGMLQRRSWARIAAMITAFLFIWNFPFGMALGIFTLIFMFSESGQRFYSEA